MPETGKILVIDDEASICEGIKRALSPAGYLVDTTTSSEDGLKMLKEGNYDLLLLDVMMPGTSGSELLPLVRAHDPELVCIIITGYATVELAVQTIKQGAYDFLTKPFSVDELNLAVSQGLERRRLALEAKRAQAAEEEARRLTEEKSRLEELDKAKRQLIRLFTHELQAPLDAIQSYLNLIRDGYVPPDKLAEVIEKCSLRLSEERDLIHDLLELGNLEVLGFPPRASPVHLDKLLSEVIDKLKEQIEQKQLKVSLQIQPGLPAILGNAEQYRSLWMNLISNAVKYTPEGGAIRVELSYDDDKIIGQVSDTGIGISQQDLPRLFTEFFRAENAKKLGLPGTGLGLVIAKRVVEGAGGQLQVDSTIGKGSTFTFTLPRHGE